MGEKLKFYTLKNILAKDAHYNVIIGERSNGKTYAVLEYCLRNYFETGEQFALIRRSDEDFSGQKGAQLAFRMLENNHYGENVVAKLSGGEYSMIEYWASAYWLKAKDPDTGKLRRVKPIGYGFALNQEQHYREGEYPDVTTIFFDELLTRTGYYATEFVDFMNIISTIKRLRQNVKIFMCGNTINKYCPYFREMGLYNVKKMKKGDLDVYRYGDSDLIVAVEFSDSPSKKKAVDPYFAFKNPKLKMITAGEWEMDIYPHLRERFKPKDIVFQYFIIFDDERLHGLIVRNELGYYMFIHRKTTEIKYPESDLVFDFETQHNAHRVYNIFRSDIPAVRIILDLFREHKVYYADNEIGEIVRNWLETSRDMANEF